MIIARVYAKLYDRDHLKMIQPFRILDLPAELIRQICTDSGFDRYGLMALRSTCTLICEFSTEIFDDMCFTGISVLLTRRSLQTLIEISKHPRIKPQIQVVSLTPLRTFPEALPSLLPADSSVYREGDLAKAKASTKVVNRYLDRYHEEMELEHTKDTVRLLTEASVSLRDYSESLCLVIDDGEKASVGTQGCFSGALVKFDEEKSVFKLRWKETMGFLVKAIKDSGFRVVRLSLVSGTNADLIGGGQLWDDDLDEDINRLSASLTAFDVDVRTHDPDAVLQSVNQVVSLANSLGILTFQRHGAEFYYDLPELSDSIAAESLLSINLSNIGCSVSEMTSFLSKYKPTLESLCLSCTHLQGSWRSLVQWIGSNLTSLRTFGMQGVYDEQYQPPDYFVPVLGFHLDEIEDMPTALEKLLAETNHREAKETGDTHSTD
jgi:hypothetical protein